MPNHQEIKTEILQAVKDRYSEKKSLSDIVAKCETELTRMTEVEGLDGKPVLDKFYSLWKSNPDKHGHENKINSWTAFCLGLTNKKPDGPFLQVRRAFARKGFPDIDSDFDYEYRATIYDYIIEKYGREHVSNTGTYQVLKLKSFVPRAFKALDPDRLYADSKEGKERWRKESNIKAREIIDSLPKQIGATLKVTDETGEHTIKNTKDAVKYCRDFKYYIDKYPDILKHSDHIEGLLSSYGVHPSGICISSIPFSDIAPVRRTKIKAGIDDEGEQQYALATQYDYNDLEAIGLIKFDVLALAMLTVIARTVKLVKENYGIDVNIRRVNLCDKDTFQLYQSGQLIGVFQCENAGMQKTMRLIGVDRFEDVVAGVALYRPGPMASIPEYAARKKKEKRIDYFHPSIEPHVKPYLETTYGVLTYQEQVMQICNSLAGFSIGDGYAVIKAVGKKIQSLLDKYRSAFIAGCVKNNVPIEVATQYWDKFITPFASYGFNKSLLETTLIPTPNGLKKLKDFQTGDEVYSVNEDGEIVLTKVVELHDHGMLEGFEVHFDDGTTVICSAEHKFLTAHGQINIMDIWRNCSPVLGTNLEQGEQYASKNMGSEMREADNRSKNDEETSVVLSDMPKLSLAKETGWDNCCTSGSLWDDFSNRKYKKESFSELRKMQRSQVAKYSQTNGETKSRQSVSVSQSNIFGNGEENFCETGNTRTKSCEAKNLENRKSRKIQAKHPSSSSQPEAFEDGNMVEISIGMEKRTHPLWRKAEACGFSKWACLDRGGWILPLFRAAEIKGNKKETNFGSQSRKRCDAKYGSEKTRCNVIENRDGLLHKLQRANEGRMVEDSSGHAPISNTGSLVSRKVVRIVPVGKQRMFDLEVACPTHNFLLSNGIVTSNSHSAAYGFVSYQTAYLKAHYPEEFMISHLNVFLDGKKGNKYEKIVEFEREMQRMGMEFLPKSINRCDFHYTIVSKKDKAQGVLKSQIRPSLRCKGLSAAAARDIIKNRPYKDMNELAFRTDPKCVDTTSIEALAEAGFFRDEKGRKKKAEDIVGEFKVLRNDLKKVKSRGVESDDVFATP